MRSQGVGVIGREGVDGSLAASEEIDGRIVRGNHAAEKQTNGFLEEGIIHVHNLSGRSGTRTPKTENGPTPLAGAFLVQPDTFQVPE